VKSIDALIDALSEQILPGPVARKKNSVLLTPAEKRVLVLLTSQITLVEVANKSHLSLNTVKSHLRSIYRKLGADSRDGAVRIAREQSLL
jgi:LuxR family maltose regulon positive regulatory protein